MAAPVVAKKQEKKETRDIEWVGDVLGQAGTRVYYKQVLIDGDLISHGDVVEIRSESEKSWFGKVMYMVIRQLVDTLIM